MLKKNMATIGKVADARNPEWQRNAETAGNSSDNEVSSESSSSDDLSSESSSSSNENPSTTKKRKQTSPFDERQTVNSKSAKQLEDETDQHADEHRKKKRKEMSPKQAKDIPALYSKDHNIKKRHEKETISSTDSKNDQRQSKYERKAILENSMPYKKGKNERYEEQSRLSKHGKDRTDYDKHNKGSSRNSRLEKGLDVETRHRKRNQIDPDRNGIRNDRNDENEKKYSREKNDRKHVGRCRDQQDMNEEENRPEMHYKNEKYRDRRDMSKYHIKDRHEEDNRTKKYDDDRRYKGRREHQSDEDENRHRRDREKERHRKLRERHEREWDRGKQDETEDKFQPQHESIEKDKDKSDIKSSKGDKDKEEPNFELSGKLTEFTNTYKGVVIKYNEPPEAREPKTKWRLYPFKGDQELPLLHLHRQSAFLLGRNRMIADIPIDHPSCSSQHAVLQFRLVDHERPDGMMGKKVKPYVIDLESSNGTFVNNNKIEARRYFELKERDVLKFGYSSREYVLLHDKSQDDEPSDEEVVSDT